MTTANSSSAAWTSRVESTAIRLKPLGRCFPKRLSDAVAFLFTIFSILATYCVELFVIVPLVVSDPNGPWIWVHRIIGTWIGLCVVWSFIGLVGVDTSICSLLLPSARPRDGWHFCHVCEANVPPRAYHCSSCNTCILRRDHHCVFSGCCVGYFNMRYYLSFLAYVTLGGQYATTVNMFYVWDLLGGFNVWNFFVHLMPFPFFFGGYLTVQQFWSCLLSIVNITGSALTMVLGVHHWGLLRANQTTYERNHRVSQWDLGSARWNTQEVLSERWLLALLVPMARISLPRDGINFPSRAEYAANSSKTR